MHKLRNNVFYSCAILGFIAWVVNTVAVMSICGVTHPILLRELFYLALLIYTFISYAQRIYDHIDTFPLRGRVEVTKGDVLVFRFLGPWISLVFQLLLTGVLLSSIQGKFFSDKKPKTVCEFRRGFR